MDKPVPHEILAQIRRVQRRKQIDVARELGYTQGPFSEMERGRRPVPVWMLKRWANVLGLAVHVWMVPRDGSPGWRLPLPLGPSPVRNQSLSMPMLLDWADQVQCDVYVGFVDGE